LFDAHPKLVMIFVKSAPRIASHWTWWTPSMVKQVQLVPQALGVAMAAVVLVGG